MDLEFKHTPVMLSEVLTWLAPKEGGIYIDGTLGGGGQSSEIIKSIGPRGRLYGLDRDEIAILAAAKRLEAYPNFQARHYNYWHILNFLKEENIVGIDGALLDLGVSSYQLDTAERGFSYHEDAILDMRMDTSKGESACEYLSHTSEEEFSRILRDYGEEKWAVRIAKIFAEHREKQPIKTTGDLVRVIDAAIPKAVRQKDEGHPARRTFQAIRIAVNNELDPLRDALFDFVKALKPQGRLCVITFHSLEDRIVKNAFREMQNPCVCPPKAPICTCNKQSLGKVLTKGAMAPSPEEIKQNPRARSAKLRIFEKK